ncbi:MAG: ABC transporter permease [bacterium]
MIWTIARRELLGYYATPLAWVLIAAAQLLLAWLLFRQLEVYQQIQPQLTLTGAALGITDLVTTPTLSSTALALLLLTPLLGMRSVAGEIASGRVHLLLSSPVSVHAILLGKWLGLVICLLPVIALSLLMALALGLGSDFDSGRWLLSGLALMLVLSLAAAVSVWTSTLTSQPSIAAVLAYAALGLIWIIDANNTESLFVWLALDRHFTPFLAGILQISHLVYFVSLTLAALALATHRLWQLRGEA